MTSTTTSPNFLERHGATPGKLKLIALLGCVLLYVIVSQIPFGGVTSASTKRRTPPTTSSPKPAGKQIAPSPIATSKPWPAPDLSVIARHDPFALPPWARSASTAGTTRVASGKPIALKDQKNVLEKLHASGIAVVMIVDGEPLALVGNRQIRVGDDLEGFEVTAITESGILLSEKGESE